MSCSLTIAYPMFFYSFFFSNDTATTEIYTLSLHDVLPISPSCPTSWTIPRTPTSYVRMCRLRWTSKRSERARAVRSEEHTSELQSHSDLVCRLLLEKKKT